MWKVGEFGKLIGISSSTLRRWEEEGKLIADRTLGNQRLYNENHLRVAMRLKTGKTPNRAIVYCPCILKQPKRRSASQVKAMEQFCFPCGSGHYRLNSRGWWGVKLQTSQILANYTMGDPRWSESVVRRTQGQVMSIRVWISRTNIAVEWWKDRCGQCRNPITARRINTRPVIYRALFFIKTVRIKEVQIKS